MFGKLKFFNVYSWSLIFFPFVTSDLFLFLFLAVQYQNEHYYDDKPDNENQLNDVAWQKNERPSIKWTAQEHNLGDDRQDGLGSNDGNSRTIDTKKGPKIRLKRQILNRLVVKVSNELEPKKEDTNNDQDEDGVNIEVEQDSDDQQQQTEKSNIRRHLRHRSIIQQQQKLNRAQIESVTSFPAGSDPIVSKFAAERREANFPVMVLLTGESYDWNLGSIYDPSLLASFGQVLVVTLNFRLGLLGKFA